MMKIDVFNHFFPPAFFKKWEETVPDDKNLVKRMKDIPSVYDLDIRFSHMDKFENYVQILSLPSPPMELYGNKSVDLAKLANDSLAGLVAKYPNRFPGFIASLPMNNPDAALAEARRAIKDLGASGVQVYSQVLGKPLDSPEFAPLFALMAELDMPIFLHPARIAKFSDYRTETESLYEIWWTFGWPYETSAAMARLVFSGIFDKHPSIKIVTHHLGGMIPYFSGRVGPGWDQLGSRTPDKNYEALLEKLAKRPIDYFKMFYADTALSGEICGATQCGLNFFGVDHVLFASDSPFDPEKGTAFIRYVTEAVDSLPISEEARKAIYEDNARKLLKLKI